MHQNIIGRSAASKMSFGDLQVYLLFPRSCRETCSFSRKLDLLFPRR